MAPRPMAMRKLPPLTAFIPGKRSFLRSKMPPMITPHTAMAMPIRPSFEPAPCGPIPAA